MKKILIFNFYLFLLILIQLLLSGCENVFCETEYNDIKTDNIPLSEFIIGKWITKRDYQVKDIDKDSIYQIEFVNNNTIELFYFTLDGNYINGDSWSYYFINQNTIHVENKHLSGGETWILLRDSQHLIITREIIGAKNVLDSERGTYECNNNE